MITEAQQQANHGLPISRILCSFCSSVMMEDHSAETEEVHFKDRLGLEPLEVPSRAPVDGGAQRSDHLRTTSPPAHDREHATTARLDPVLFLPDCPIGVPDLRSPDCGRTHLRPVLLLEDAGACTLSLLFELHMGPQPQPSSLRAISRMLKPSP